MTPFLALLAMVACRGDPPVEEAATLPPPAATPEKPALPEAVLDLPQTPPDLVVVVAPGLRADIGGDQEAASAFAAVFGDRVRARFTTTYAQTPSPYVSLGSLLTGRYPSGIPFCGRQTLAPDGTPREQWCGDLPQRRRTLPELLRDAGYRTALFQANLAGAATFAHRFDNAVDLTASPEDWTMDWTRLQAELGAWWNADADHPRLAMVVVPDLMVMHRDDLLQAMGVEQEGPPPTQGMAPPARDGKAPGPRGGGPPRGGDGPDGRSGPGPGGRGGPGGQGGPGPNGPSGEDAIEPGAGERPGKGAPGTGPAQAKNPWADLDHQVVTAVYADAAAAVGTHVAELLVALPTVDTRQRWTVLTSTNGLSLGETTGGQGVRRTFAFNEAVLERTVHVPLVILGHGEGTRTVTQPVELVDLVPTLLSLAGVQTPGDLPGEDLLSPSFYDDSLAVAYVEYDNTLALRQGSLLLTLHGLHPHANSVDPRLSAALDVEALGAGYTLHDVVTDPLQWVSRLDERTSDAIILRESMRAIRGGSGAMPDDTDDSQLLQEAIKNGTAGYW